MAVLTDAHNIASGTNVSTLGVSLTVASNADRVLLGYAMTITTASVTLTSSTWGADAMTEFTDTFGTYTGVHGSRLVAPAAETRTLTMNFSATVANLIVGGHSVYNADQTTPLGTVSVTNANNAIPWVSCVGVTDGLSVGVLASDATGALTPRDGIPMWISSGTHQVAATATSLTVTNVPAGRIAGDLEICTWGRETTAAETLSGSGWNLLNTRTFGTTRSRTVAWRIYDGTNVDPGLSWSGTADVWGRRHCWRDTKASGTPIAVLGTFGSGTGTTHTSTGGNTTEADVKAIYLDDANANTALGAPGGSWTERFDAGSATGPSRTAGGDQPIATAGTGSGNLSMTGAGTAWIQEQFEVYNSDAGDQLQLREVESLGATSGGSFDTEGGMPFNTFGWTITSAQWRAFAVGINPAAAVVNAPRQSLAALTAVHRAGFH